MKTQQELLLHYWGPHYDMVKEYNVKHGCDVKPWKCVKLGNDPMEQHPAFDIPVDNYTFALTILYDDKRKEHRPVFVGSRLWLNHIGTFVEVTGEVKITPRDYSWNPPKPKRTFKLEFTEEEFKHLCDITSNWYSRHGTTIKEKLAAARDKE